MYCIDHPQIKTTVLLFDCLHTYNAFPIVCFSLPHNDSGMKPISFPPPGILTH